MIINIDDTVKLELTEAKHANALYDAVDRNRQHLSEFLPWVGQMKSVADFKHYIDNCQLLFLKKKEVSFVIFYNDEAVGRIGLHHMNLENRNASIGYWLSENAEGKGIITRSTEKLITYGFNELGLHRIEIKAAVQNVKSQAIAQKLNFTKEGILREAEFVNGVYLDLVLYSILSHEWK